jgi:hypothetical protein
MVLSHDAQIKSEAAAAGACAAIGTRQMSKMSATVRLEQYAVAGMLMSRSHEI